MPAPGKPFTIGAAARHTGVPERTIRYYESIGLLAPGRASNDYREFGEREMSRLRFVARARSLGFSTDDCRNLLALYENPARASAQVRELADAHLAEMDRKIADLQRMRGELAGLVAQCRGNQRPKCPILDRLADDAESKSVQQYG